jgi:hypothetical protein
MSASSWQPIATAPQDGTDILVLVEDGGRRIRLVARWSENMRGGGWYGKYGWMVPGYLNIALESVSPPPVMWHPLTELPPLG